MASAVSSSSFHCLPSSSRSFPSPTQNATRVRLQKPRAVSAVYAAAAAPSTLYEVLGIQREATCQEIKSAYRSLARVLHPDVNDVVSADDFIRVREAYSTLSDPAKRADYDRALFIRRRLGEGPHFVGEGGPVSPRFTRRSWETDQCW